MGMTLASIISNGENPKWDFREKGNHKNSGHGGIHDPTGAGDGSPSEAPHFLNTQPLSKQAGWQTGLGPLYKG